MTALRTPADIAALVQFACLLEVSAPKPGNVSPGHHFTDLRYEDFLASAVAIGEVFQGVAKRPLGQTICQAVEATSRWTATNTNLGLVLVLAPLARAAATAPVREPEALRAAVRQVLDETTVDDASEVYAAIRRASPGGLGAAASQDVAGDPDVTLLQAMQLAADRDGIAREYATAFQTTFERGAPALEQARRDGLPWSDAIVETYLRLLAAAPDTHIVRRTGTDVADEVSRWSQQILEAGGVRSAAGRQAIQAMDAELRDKRHSKNPGTTADLTAAAIFVTLICSNLGGLNATAR